MTCSGSVPGSGIPAACNDAGDLCVTISSFNADFTSRSWTVSPSGTDTWAGGDAEYDVTVDMTITSGGSRAVFVYIINPLTSFGAIYAQYYFSFDCAGGFTVTQNSYSESPPSGTWAATTTVIEGTCP